MGEDPAGLPLNLVCFDEIDALCRSRGSLSGDTSGVRDSVVNQASVSFCPHLRCCFAFCFFEGRERRRGYVWPTLMPSFWFVFICMCYVGLLFVWEHRVDAVSVLVRSIPES